MIYNYGRLFLLVFVIVLSACTSGKKLYEQGAYYEAVMASVQKLRQNPDHKKSIEALKNAYPLAMDYLQTDVKNQIASNSPNKWRNAIASYDKINQMYESIRQSPKALKIIKDPKNFYTEIGPLKEKAAEESYTAGIDALMKGNRNDAKKAYYNFADAQSFSPGYKDVVEYLDKSKDEATLKVIVEQVAVPARYSLSGDFFQDKVEAFLHQNYPDRGFIKFFTPEEAQRIKLVNELAKRGNNTFYILDEPTTGLHTCDVAKLIEVLQRLVEQGNSVLVIEHNLDLLKVVDHLIDIGPDGGQAGGTIVAAGTPEQVAAAKSSITGRYLKKLLSN